MGAGSRQILTHGASALRQSAVAATPCAKFPAGMSSLKGQTALVTGAGRRIGRAIALRLAAEGARVAVHYRNSRAEAEALVAEIVRAGGEAVSMQAELTRVAEIDALFDRIEQTFAGLDILVNNAAIFSPPRLARPRKPNGTRSWTRT